MTHIYIFLHESSWPDNLKNTKPDPKKISKDQFHDLCLFVKKKSVKIIFDH